MSSAGDFSSAQALSVYAQPLVEGKRVLVVGDASSPVGPMLVELGARVVHVYDADRGRVLAAEPTRGVSFFALPEKDFDVRDGAFDLAIVPDLSTISDRPALLARLRRIVGREGAAIVAARNPAATRMSSGNQDGNQNSPDAIDYYELYELISLQFESVRMIGQVPFVGVALVELGVDEEETEVTVDAQLAGETEPPEFFIALASQDDAQLAPYAIVQLPRTIEAAPVSIGTRASIAESGLRADLLSAQLDDRNSAARELETRAMEAMAMAERIAVDASRSEEKLDVERARHQQQIASYEEEIAVRAARIAVLEGAFSAMEEASRDIERRVVLAERAAEDHAERSATMLVELEDARAAAAAAAELNGSALSHEGEVAELEAHLRNRGTHIASLEREVARREQIVLDLLSQLANAPKNAVIEAPGAVAIATQDDKFNVLYDENIRLRSKLDALALELARREGELATTMWRVTEVEEELAHLKQMPSELAATDGLRDETAGLRAELDKAQDELDLLRRALAQEHEARAKETGSRDEQAGHPRPD